MRARKHAILHERGARRRNAILEHAGPVLGSNLGKIGQGSTGDGDAQARPGALGGAGRGALILPWGAGRGALVSAPQRPCQPWLRSTRSMRRSYKHSSSRQPTLLGYPLLTHLSLVSSLAWTGRCCRMSWMHSMPTWRYRAFVKRFRV